MEHINIEVAFETLLYIYQKTNKDSRSSWDQFFLRTFYKPAKSLYLSINGI